MATSWTLAVVIVLGLVLGWRYHFRVVEHRKMITQMAARAEQTRQAMAHTPVNTVVVAAPGTAMPETPSLLLGNATPQQTYNPNARTVPRPTVVEVLPLVNAGSILSEAEQTLDKYLKTPQWQDRLQFVFEPERVRRLMEDYYENQHDVDPVCGPLIDQGRFRLNGTEVVLLAYRSGRPTGRLEIMLRRSGAGRLVIDWESFVGYSEKSFTELAETRPTSPVLIRGFVQLDDYYNYEYSDSKQYLSLKVTSPDASSFLNAYCLRDSAMARWLLADLGGTPERSLTKGYPLWITYPDKAKSGLRVNLVQIPAGRWLVLPNE